MKAAQVATGFGIFFLVVKIICGIVAYSQTELQVLLVSFVVAGLIELLLVFGALLKNKCMIIAWLVFAYLSLVGSGLEAINLLLIGSTSFAIGVIIGFTIQTVAIIFAHKTIGEINEERENVVNRIQG